MQRGVACDRPARAVRDITLIEKYIHYLWAIILFFLLPAAATWVWNSYQRRW